MNRGIPTNQPPDDDSDALAAGFEGSYSGVVAFMTVVAEGSFVKAGDRLGIDRSAVSRSVQKLEAQLGVRLFSRTTRSLALTDEGERFHERCRPGVELITEALEGNRDTREGPPRGQLRVCSTVGFGRKVIAPLLRDFRAAYPAVDVELVLDDGPTNFTSDRIDVSFRNGRMDDSQVIAKLLFPMQMLVCASPGYARAHGLPLSVDDIADHRCINFRLASGRLFEWEFRVQGRLCKVKPQGPMTFNDADSCSRPWPPVRASRRWRPIRPRTCCARADSSGASRSTHPTIAATISAISVVATRLGGSACSSIT